MRKHQERTTHRFNENAAGVLQYLFEDHFALKLEEVQADTIQFDTHIYMCVYVFFFCDISHDYDDQHVYLTFALQPGGLVVLVPPRSAGRSDARSIRLPPWPPPLRTRSGFPPVART